MAQRERSAVVLIRHADRNPENPDELKSGQKQDEKGSYLRGEGFIEEVVGKLLSPPPELIIHANTGICRATLQALLKHSKELVWLRLEQLRESKEVYFQEKNLETWAKVLSGPTWKTLADAKTAEEQAIAQGIVSDISFFREEGERLFNFVVDALRAFPPGSTLFVITHSPLPEELLLWLWGSKPPAQFLQKARSLADIPTLGFLDNYTLIFRDGELEYIKRKDYAPELKERDTAKGALEGLAAMGRKYI